MTGSRQPQINEELLSAYLDNEVTAEERALVEAAIAADPAIAWQVESLRQTVHLLQALPPLALPRAFTLEAVVADAPASQVVTVPQVEPGQPWVANPRPKRTKQTTDTEQNNGWQWLLQLWQGGNLQLRNAAAVAFTLLIVLVVSDRLVGLTHLRQPTRVPAPAAKLITTSESETITSAAIVMATAPIETATNPAQTVATPVVAESIQAMTAPDAPRLSAKTGADQDSTTASEGVAMLRSAQPLRTGEDLLDLSGSQQESFGDQPGQGDGMATMMTDDSRTMATASSGPATLTQTVPDVTANQADQAPNMVVATAASALTTPATVTATPTSTVTATVTATAIISAPDQTGIGTDTKVSTTPSAPSNDVQTAPAPALQSWLAWAEMIAGLCTVILGALWWRSRGFTHA